jgi:mono/diheme cytochrome c family protein
MSLGTGARVLVAVAVLTGMTCGGALGDQATVDRGRYVFDAGGCAGCHTDAKAGGAALAGGLALETSFGTFYAPNITPDPDHGIGRWNDRDFLRAMRDGIGPDNRHYYPAFPYTSYTGATERDLLDLKAYLFAQPSVAQASRPHEVEFPFSIRPLLWFWKLLNFDSIRWRPDTFKSDSWNRGSYLVEALSHCRECHTPRNFLGGLDASRWFAGARLGDGKSLAPNLTSHEQGLARWSESDITLALDFGFSPDGEAFGDAMGEVVRNTTSRLTAADRMAIAAYLKALPALPSAARRKSE